VRQISYFDFFRGPQTITSTVPTGELVQIEAKAAQAGDR
jgi:hypothetical protein